MESPDPLRNVSSRCQQTTIPQRNQPKTSPLSSNRVVVFADMLGFAALTEANPIDLRMLHARGRGLPLKIDDIVRISKNPLTKAFSSFHLSIEWAIASANSRHPLTAVTFSDSVFFATTYLFEATSFAVDLAQSLLSQNVPVRMGIAFGSFAALRFRSDVSADSDVHASQFLGAAVVRAYQAEKCGIKGMRILVHPSVESLVADGTHNPASPPIGICPIRTLECSNSELANKAGVRYELDYWDLATTKERAAWHALQDMWAVAPDSAREHYQATAEAINRMRTAQGEAPLADLRRRTLPRRRR